MAAVADVSIRKSGRYRAAIRKKTFQPVCPMIIIKGLNRHRAQKGNAG
jgi:hypothetical protein